MRIVGVDPGLANLGLGAIEAEGSEVRHVGSELVRTRASDDEGVRLAAIHDAFDAFLDTHRPAAVALEGQFFHRQRETSLKVGQALGVIVLCAHRRGAPTFSYGPLQVKQTLVGTGRADKAQVAYMVRALLGMPSAPEHHHVSDALALALTHWSSHRLNASGAALRAADAASASPSGRRRRRGGA
ncbi:MAG: crossover junction endodeoxyribonuclease RuvC [Trueperaceae bacterium]|nr:crossover junction endodeoxyribonuclease RuvC [Trueperaceae bacterium]